MKRQGRIQNCMLGLWNVIVGNDEEEEREK